ncbi:MAG: autotransporter outer membrane beta-barrel domain-containing protein [Leptotrichiaceae bacterium]|nr:autotransporter outer membrane beta-barrel domain-containing protein [Leptotrichiaceae bacterium]
MKKLLLLGALILSVNAFSAISIVGPSTNLNVGQNISGNGSYSLGAGANTMTITGTSMVTPGIKFAIMSNSSLTIVNGAGVTVTTINGPATVSVVSALDANVTAGTVSSVLNVQPVGTGPTPTPPSTPGGTIIPSLPSTPGASSAKIYMARSKVDLELTKNITDSGFRSLENAGNNGVSLDVDYIGGGGRYTDNSQNVKYNSKSNGVSLIGTKNFGNFTFGGGFGFQKSKVRYKENFENVKEKLDSYQFMLSGKYNFTENVDLSSVLTYSHNSHKYEAPNGVNIQGLKYNSKILDFQTRLGAKYGESNGYVKPYVGLGITSVKEGAIEKLGIGKASGTSGNATLGVYGQVSLGTSVDLFGNMEYEYTFNKKSYHRERELTSGGKIEGLDYDDGLNLGLGLKYKFSKFNVTTAYELNKAKNNVFKVGFGAEF